MNWFKRLFNPQREKPVEAPGELSTFVEVSAEGNVRKFSLYASDEDVHSGRILKAKGLPRLGARLVCVSHIVAPISQDGKLWEVICRYRPEVD